MRQGSSRLTGGSGSSKKDNEPAQRAVVHLAVAVMIHAAVDGEELRRRSDRHRSSVTCDTRGAKHECRRGLRVMLLARASTLLPIADSKSKRFSTGRGHFTANRAKREVTMRYDRKICEEERERTNISPVGIRETVPTGTSTRSFCAGYTFTIWL